MKENIIQSEITVPSPSAINKHGVSKKLWSKWTDNAKVLFNYLMDSVEDNRNSVTGLDMFEVSGEVDKLLGCTTWNMAWLAACKLSRIEKGKDYMYATIKKKVRKKKAVHE